MKILAVTRAGAYSPNHIGNDAAIMNLTIEQLRRRGCEVRMLSEESFLDADVEEEVIIDMCRRTESIEKLKALAEQGKLVINSGDAISNCMRERVTRLLMGNGIPHPDSIIVDTNADARPELRAHGIERCWVKRGELHAQHKEDVAFCRHPEEAQEILHEFYFRGIGRAVINRHLEGDLVKFYGLADDSFFYHFYPLDNGHSKFGDEAINGPTHNYPIKEEELRAACVKAAEITGIRIFGGDCIVDEDGSFRIIDFNDWPSFAPCREEAAPYIAKLILNDIKDFLGHKEDAQSQEKKCRPRRAAAKGKEVKA